MKKVIYAIVGLLIMNSSFGQVSVSEDNNIKNFRFGLLGESSINWLSPDNQKKFQNGGTPLGFGWGIQMEFRLNKVTSIVTGFGLYNTKSKLDFAGASSADTAYYLLNKDASFVNFSDSATNLAAGNTMYWLQNRTYKINYVTIPLAIKMKTKEIGYMTYFGQFGANIGIKTKTRVNDEVIAYGSSNKTTISDLNLDKGTQPVRMGLTIGGGGEYNFSGTTSLFFGVNYNHFFTNALKKEDPYLMKGVDANGVGGTPIAQKAIPGSVSVVVGILF